MITINKKLRTDVIEVVIGSSSGSEVTLGIIENLRNAPYIKKIEAFHAGQISNTPKGATVIDLATFQKCFLTLRDSQGTEYKTIPLVSLSKIANGTIIENIDLPTIDPTKSFVKIADGAVIPVGSAFLFAITYEKP